MRSFGLGILLVSSVACSTSAGVSGNDTPGDDDPDIELRPDAGSEDPQPDAEPTPNEVEIDEGRYSIDFLEIVDDCGIWAEILDAPYDVTAATGGFTFQAEGSDTIVECDVKSDNPVTFECIQTYSTELLGWEATTTVFSTWSGSFHAPGRISGSIETDITCVNDVGSEFNGCADYSGFEGYSFPCEAEELIVAVIASDIPSD
tara:strand:+ start:9233 stop:9841 length:609 start_codon:yes stop_codon:yes gene_type:complete